MCRKDFFLPKILTFDLIIEEMKEAENGGGLKESYRKLHFSFLFRRGRILVCTTFWGVATPQQLELRDFFEKGGCVVWDIVFSITY